jgi:hypothetical protein
MRFVIAPILPAAKIVNLVSSTLGVAADICFEI